MPETLIPATPDTQAIIHAPESGAPAHRRRLALLCLASLGIVYGDIGTSPLYALKESLSSAAAGGLTHPLIFRC